MFPREFPFVKKTNKRDPEILIRFSDGRYLTITMRAITDEAVDAFRNAKVTEITLTMPEKPRPGPEVIPVKIATEGTPDAS